MDSLRADNFKKAILWGIIIIALFSALFTLVQRHRVEAESNCIEIIIDYTKLREFSKSIGVPPLIVLQRLKQAGLTSVAITEETLQELLEESKVVALSGKQLLNVQKIAGTELIPAEKINSAHLYFWPQTASGEELYNRLSKKLGADNVVLLENENFKLIQVSRSGKDLNKLGIGFDEQLIESVSALGLKIVARPFNFPGISEEDIEQTFEQLMNSGDLSMIIFAGDEVYGYSKQMESTAKILKSRGINYGAAETPVQRGFIPFKGQDEIFKLMDYGVVRVYSATVSEIKNPTVLNLVDNAVRSVKERNIRALYLKPIDNYPQSAPEEQLKNNLDYLRMIKSELEKQGYTVGVAKPFASFWTNLYLTAFVVAGVAAAAFLVVNLFFTVNPVFELVLLCLAWLGSLFLLRSSSGILLRQVVAALAATVFPTIAVVPFLSPGEKQTDFKSGLVRAVLSFFKAVIISLLGGLFVGALLGDLPFLIEYYYFRGVKLVHLLPLLFLVLVYLRNRGTVNSEKQMSKLGQTYVGGRNFFSKQVNLGHLALLFLIAVAGYVYLGRTGHTAGIPVPNFEVQLRALLDSVLFIRPRTKEFLIGHPGLVLAAYLSARGYYHYVPLIVIGSTIGQISIVNSFAHLRTPVVLSFLRTFNGVWLGLVLGLIVCILAEIFLKLADGLRRSVDD